MKDSFIFGEREEGQGGELEPKLFKEDRAIRMRDQRSNIHITLHMDMVVGIRVCLSQSPCPHKSIQIKILAKLDEASQILIGMRSPNSVEDKLLINRHNHVHTIAMPFRKFDKKSYV